MTQSGLMSIRKVQW